MPQPSAENIFQLPNTRRPAPAAPARVTRPQPLAIIPFEAWVTIRDRATAALLGGTRFVLITGPAGTGKTVMLEDVARVLRAAGRTVLVRQADTDPAPPQRGETLFVDEADRLPQARLRQLIDASAGTLMLAGLGTLAQRASGKPLHLTLGPLGQETARDYVAQWLASTGRGTEQLDSAALRQVVEASGGVPRLLSTLLAAGAWLAESSNAATITATHIQEAADLRSVLSPPAIQVGRARRRRSRIVVPATVAVLALVAAVGALASKLYPDESAALLGTASDITLRTRQWLGGAPDAPASVTAALPPISQHVIPRPEAAVITPAGAPVEAALPSLVNRAAPTSVVQATPIATATLPQAGAALPIETQAFLIRRGHEMAAVGDLSAARLLFRRAAEGGSAEAAYALGRTYDPSVMTGLWQSQADGAEATQWYRRAAAAGDAAAKAALATE